jgi:hypothetical protein
MNTNYDEKLLQIENLKWLPFIGKNYDLMENKILFVGESHYFDPNSPNLNFEKKEFTRMVVDEMAICNFQYGSPFFNKISELFNSVERTQLWNNVSFYNFIQRAMNKGEKVRQGVIERPKNLDFVNGWKIFFDVLNTTTPDYCLFFGNTSANSFNKSCSKYGIDHRSVVWEENINRSYLKRAEVMICNHKTEIIFIKHPSSYFSTNKWRDLLNKKFPKIETSIR